MRRTLISLMAAAAGTLGACSLDITNPNSPTQSGALTNPRDAASREIVGVLANYRDNRADQIRSFGSFGRETYYMFITDGRFITGPYRDWKQNNAFEAGTQWAGRYGNYRNAYAAIKLVNSTPALTPAEKAGALGVLNTFIALDMLHVIEARGAIGAVVGGFIAYNAFGYGSDRRVKGDESYSPNGNTAYALGSFVGSTAAVQLIGMGDDLVLSFGAADRRHLRHAGDSQKPAPHDRVGDGPQLERILRVRRNRKEQNLAHDRRDRGEHRPFDLRRQRAADEGELLGDDLPRLKDVRAPVELHPHHGDPEGGQTLRDAARAGGAARRRREAGRGRDDPHLAEIVLRAVEPGSCCMKSRARSASLAMFTSRSTVSACAANTC